MTASISPACANVVYSKHINSLINRSTSL